MLHFLGQCRKVYWQRTTITIKLFGPNDFVDRTIMYFFWITGAMKNVPEKPRALCPQKCWEI